MDGFVVAVLALILTILYTPKESQGIEAGEDFVQPIVRETFQLNPGSNPQYYHDELAFIKIAHELGVC